MSKALIVDDEPTYCWALQRLLSLEGFEVETAADGREAIDLASRMAPDLLVVDWMLQGNLNGLEVAETLQQADHRLRVVVITGHPAVECELHQKDVHAVRVLTKPFQTAELLAVIEQLLAE